MSIQTLILINCIQSFWQFSHDFHAKIEDRDPPGPIWAMPEIIHFFQEVVPYIKHWVTRPKNFIETDTETFFRDRDFFSRPNIFKTDTGTFFWDQNFRDRYRDFFSRPNVFETDTETFFSRPNVFETNIETFFRDQMFSRLIPRLFFETKRFRDRYQTFFETKCFRDWYRDFCKS